MTKADTKNRNETFLDVIEREAGYRRCIILEGNVRDLFDDGKKHYLSLPKVLMSRLTAMKNDGRQCFSICGSWDRVDGLMFADPIMQQAFQRALKNPASVSSSCGCPSPTSSNREYDDGSGGSGVPNNRSSVSNGILKQPEEAFPAMRRILSCESERAVFILDWQEYLVGNPAHQELPERQLLTVLGKAIADAGWAGSDALKGPTGLLIVIASNLGSLPDSLYKDNPRTKVITIPKPDRPQRLAFLTHNQRDLHVAEPKLAPGQPVCRYGSCDAILSQMADLCDDLTMVDMQNLLALSCQQTSKMRPDRLLNFYKFGKQVSPWRDLDKRKLDNVFELLQGRVMGQDHALKAAEAMLQTAYVELEDPSKRKQPRGIMFYVGPTGVGKTELAKAIAEFVYGDENALISLDMSNYSQDHDVQRLVGAPPSYVGFSQGGELTNRISQKPFSVVVFDEIEKAHRSLWDKFLQILEEGRLTDGRGQTVFFSQTVIIFTSNIGQNCEEDLTAMAPADLETHFKNNVINFCAKPIRQGGLGRPELVDRIGKDNIVGFHYITEPDIRQKILKSKLVPLKEIFRERFGMGFDISDRCINWLESRSRTGIIRRDITNTVKYHFRRNRLTPFVYQHLHQLKPGRTLFTDVAEGKDDIKFVIREADPDETE